MRNTGAAFSLFVGFSPYLMAIGLVMSIIVIFIHHFTTNKNPLFHTSLSFILGGSLGNLIDRALRGYVIDYIDLSFWPVFNLADIMINLGAAMFLFTFLKKEDNNAPDPI